MSNLAKELTVTTRVLQRSSNELSTSLSVSVNCKQMETFNSYTLDSLVYVGLLVAVSLYHQADVKLAGFLSQLQESRMSSHTDEL